MLRIPLIVLCSVSVGFAVNPLFKEEPKNQSVLLGGDVLLRCVAQPSPTGDRLFSQWRDNEGALLGMVDSGTVAGHSGRYSYVRESADEKHLFIEKVTLEDDGKFECQMMRQGVRTALRAAAFVSVIVPPGEPRLLQYRSGSVVDVNENTPLNITCLSACAKPAAELKWFANGKLLTENVEAWLAHHVNRTVSSFAALLWVPRRTDDKRVLTCELSQEATAYHRRVNITLNVLYPSDRPRIDVIGGSAVAKAGDNVTLLCTATGGNPPPNVTWFLNQRPIGSNFYYDYASQETKNSYSVVVDADDNSANYECRSLNRVGGEPLVESIKLSVSYAPLGVEIYGESSARMGKSVFLHCRTRVSNPPSKITWLLNGHSVLSEGDGYENQANGVVSTSNYTVKTADMIVSDHQVSVECIAKNEQGQTSKQHLIKIYSPPMDPIIYGMEGELLLEGESLNLTCEARGGYPPATLSWFRGIEKLKESRSTAVGGSYQSAVSMVVDRSMNHQQIRCEAENGAVDEPLVAAKFISVLFPPHRVMIRKDDTTRRQFVAGEGNRLLCVVPSSNPAAIILWQFSYTDPPIALRGTNRHNRTSREFGGFEVENVLEFMPIEEMDGTDVKCIASHPHWNEQKVVAYPLTVLYPPRLAVSGPITIVVGEGDSFKENLTVRANPSVATWRWKKNGVPFDHTVGAVFARGAVLSGRSVSGGDSGTYTLVAANSIGSVNVTLLLTVEFAARVVEITSPVIASNGEEVVLECEVDGVPRRDGMVKWLRGDTPLSSVSYTRLNRALLTINASLDAEGPYTCVADNGIGKANFTYAYLLINKPPSISRDAAFMRAAGSLGATARLVCRARAVPACEFRWVVEGEANPLQLNSTKYSTQTLTLDTATFESYLWISGLEQFDYQRPVKCIASNRFGEDVVQITVGPLTAPDIPSGLHLLNASSSKLTLGWSPGFDGGTNQRFEVRYRKLSDDKSRTSKFPSSNGTIVGLESSSGYELSVRALNDRGLASEFSRPPLLAYTKNERGMDVYPSEQKSKMPFSGPLMVVSILGVCALLIINCVLLCYVHRRQKRKKMQEKTEMVRKVHSSEGSSDVRPVQMYGALTNTEDRYCAESVNTNRSELDVREPVSEDDQSVRTMIEVNPNGYLQQIDPTGFYDREYLVEYDFDHVIHQGAARRGLPSYSNIPYPEPPADEVSLGAPSFGYSDGGSSLKQSDGSVMGSPRRTRHPSQAVDSSPSLGFHLVSSNGTPQMLSTFMQPSGVHTAPFDYAHIDGDLV